MRPLGNAYRDAEASTGEFQRLPAGGYIARITAVKDVPDKLYLQITFDIAEGEFKAFYAETDAAHEWLHSFVRSYKETALGMFKGFLKAIDESNDTGFEAQAEKGFDERKLVGKLIGILVGYEEYISNRGDVRERVRVTGTRTVKTIREGKFKVPELKKLSDDQARPAQQAAPAYESPVDGFTPMAVNEEDLPF